MGNLGLASAMRDSLTRGSVGRSGEGHSLTRDRGPHTVCDEKTGLGADWREKRIRVSSTVSISVRLHDLPRGISKAT